LEWPGINQIFIHVDPRFRPDWPGQSDEAARERLTKGAHEHFPRRRLRKEEGSLRRKAIYSDAKYTPIFNSTN